jgi:hypothetical protein
MRSGETWTQQAKLLAVDGARDDNFGLSVALDGNMAVVGARHNDELADNAGAAYVFERSGDTWTQQTKLLASDGEIDDLFGRQVALEGNTIIVTAALADPEGVRGAGAAYVFTHDGTDWAEQAKLVASDAGEGDLFGSSVALAGDTVLISARNRDGDDGGIYVFSRSGGSWTEQAIISNPDRETAGLRFGTPVAFDGVTVLAGADFAIVGGRPLGAAYTYELVGDNWTQQDRLTRTIVSAAEDHFGTAVAVHNGTTVIGVPQANDQGEDSGSAYVFVGARDVWTQQAKLLPNDGALLADFGRAVSVDEDTAVIGAPLATDSGIDSGAAYVFVRDGDSWAQQAKLLATDRVSGDLFGAAVVVDDDTALIGAEGHDASGDAAGAVYIFVRTGEVWTQQAKLLALDGSAGDLFGFSVDLDGDSAIVGALFDDALGVNAGSAYVFERSGGIWLQAAKLLASDGSANNQFGKTVAIDGETVLVGAPRYDDPDQGQKAGAVYAFYRKAGIWSERERLRALGGFGGDRFGGSVALDGDHALIGAVGRPDSPSEARTNSGAAYIFERRGLSWLRQRKVLTAESARSRDQFGTAVAINGQDLIVGVPLDDQAVQQAGAAFVFSLGIFPAGITVPDVDDDGVDDLALLRPGSVIGGVLSGKTADEIFTAELFEARFSGLEAAVVPDLNGNNGAELAVLGLRDDDSTVVRLWDTRTGAKLRNVSLLGPGQQPIALVVVPDGVGTTGRGIGVLARRKSDGLIFVHLRDAITGAAIGNVKFFDQGFKAVDATVLPDLDLDGVPELAVLAIRLADERYLVEIRNVRNAPKPRRVWFRGPGTEPVALATTADVDRNGVPELGVLGIRSSDQRLFVERRNAIGPRNTVRRWMAPTLSAPIDFAVVPDSDADGTPEYAVLAQRCCDARFAVDVQNAAGQPNRNTIWYRPKLFGQVTWLSPQSILSLGDTDDNGVFDFGVLATREIDGRVRLELRNSRGETFPRSRWLTPE